MNSNGRCNPNGTAAPQSQLDQETSVILRDDGTTTIHIENDLTNNQTQIQRPQSLPQVSSSTSINMEGNIMDEVTGSRMMNNSRASVRSVPQNFLSLINEARTQLGRQASYPGNQIHHHRIPEPSQFATVNNIDEATSPQFHGRNIRNWRMNLNNVLSLSSVPTREALRSFINPSRYTQLATGENFPNVDNVHLLLNHDQHQSSSEPANYRISARRISPLQDLNSAASLPGPSVQANVNTNGRILPTTPISLDANLTNRLNENNTGPHSPGRNAGNRNDAPEADIDEDNSVISEMLIKALSHFVRYVPFICILFVKFIHDHIFGILDLIFLHIVMYNINKSLRNQISKFSNKSYGILVRDFSFVLFVVVYRFLLASAAPDFFGLFITPPPEDVAVEVPLHGKDEVVRTITEQPYSSKQLVQLTAVPKMEPNLLNSVDSVVTIQKSISLGILLYYVAVNDLILKLITILTKIVVTMLPTKVIRFKPRARLYVLIEYSSQFYRAMVPAYRWLIYLFASYTGLEVISGILFSSFYIGAKTFELLERGKSLRTALLNFIRNMDYDRKPTKDELDAAGTLCPICHDNFNSPVVLECSHIFCDDCVSTWFKREQTCPMCRAKVSEDPQWQDGSTTFFYQLC